MNPVQLFLLNALIVVTSLWLLFGFVLGFTVAQNADMSPNIKEHDLLLYYRLGDSPNAQDVVVINKNNITYIGRVIAVGGDKIDITDDCSVVINDRTIIESNVYSSTSRYEGFVDYPVHLNSGEYFILCDSRNGSEDSRYYGVVSENEIAGRVITVLRRSNL